MFISFSSRIGTFVITSAAALSILIGSSPTPASAEMYNLDEVVVAAVPAIDQYWTDVFANENLDYSSPEVVYYNTVESLGPVDSACGEVPLANAVHCSLDQTIYLDYSFLAGAIDFEGDFAAAMVIAHEWGHHIHYSLGISPTRDGEIDQEGEVYSIEAELLADCFAGTTSAHFEQMGMLESGDLDEAYNLVLKIGDMPGSDPTAPGAHGDSDQRLASYFGGYESGDPSQCVDVVISILG